MVLGVHTLLLFAILAVWQASAQAPGDEDRRCVNQRGDVYPANTRMLMDSRNYEQLITGSSAVWQAVDMDGTGRGWTSAFGGLCESEARVCDFREELNASQENWLFTQYIRFINAREVSVNISINFAECRQNSNCNQLFVDLYIYERNGREDTVARNIGNYRRVRRIEQPSAFSGREYAASFSFAPLGNFSGFYLGFRDTASSTCVNIQRLQVYYRFHPQRVVGLVTYPEIALPPENTTTPTRLVAICAANSQPTSSLQFMCYSNGTCVGNPSCQCRVGYQEVQLQNREAECRACPAGTYHSQSDPAESCIPCPDNTDMSLVAVAICPCISGFFRTAQEDQSFSCTRPPTAVRNLRVIYTTNTSFGIQWDVPLVTGRPDYFYSVEYSNPNNILQYIQHNQRKVTTTSIYPVTGLRPFTTYIIRVSVHNGVSGNDSANDAERRLQISHTTLEGVPSAPSNVQGLCTTIVWNKPSQTNGVLTGYDLRFYSNNQEIIVSNRSDENFRIVKEIDKPSASGDIFVQVRGKTRAGPGNWSEGMSLGCPTTEDKATPTSMMVVPSGYTKTVYLAIAVVVTFVLTTIVVISIVLTIVCLHVKCKKTEREPALSSSCSWSRVKSPS